MRLTLRTLLAWLDDTLPPTQVREIGRQVAESPYAQELVERIHRVTRQRRLTVPSRSGPDGTDPNVVAGYVDNDLDADEVAEYEKKCLSSDVNLAEASCVHQILSLLGQKVHVPDEAKARMYQLVKGRESIPKHRGDGAKKTVRTPVTEPIQPWVAPPPPSRHWVERFGPLAGCLLLIGVLCWSAYQSLTPERPAASPVTPVQQPVAVVNPQAPHPVEQQGANPVPGQAEPHAGDTVPGPLVANAPAPSATTDAEPEVAKPAGSVDTEKTAREAAPIAPARAVPSGSIGIVDKVDGLLLRFSAEKRAWERIAEGTPLSTSDRLLCLEPFRARILIARTPITLIGETLVVLTTKAVQEPPAFELSEGRADRRLGTAGHTQGRFRGIDGDDRSPLGGRPGIGASQPVAVRSGGDAASASGRACDGRRGHTRTGWHEADGHRPGHGRG